MARPRPTSSGRWAAASSCHTGTAKRSRMPSSPSCSRRRPARRWAPAAAWRSRRGTTGGRWRPGSSTPIGRSSPRGPGAPADDGVGPEGEPQTGGAEPEVERGVLRRREVLRIPTDPLPASPGECDAPRARQERLGADLVEGPLREETHGAFLWRLDKELVPASDDVSLAALEWLDNPLEPRRLEHAHVRRGDELRAGFPDRDVPAQGTIAGHRVPVKPNRRPCGELREETWGPVRGPSVRHDDDVRGTGLALEGREELGQADGLVPHGRDDRRAHAAGWMAPP